MPVAYIFCRQLATFRVKKDCGCVQGPCPFRPRRRFRRPQRRRLVGCLLGVSAQNKNTSVDRKLPCHVVSRAKTSPQQSSRILFPRSIMPPSVRNNTTELRLLCGDFSRRLSLVFSSRTERTVHQIQPMSPTMGESLH